MNPVLWGPAVWQMLFACAWHCPQANADELRDLLLRLVPLLLPCRKCRHHYAQHRAVVNRRAHGEPKTPEHAFRWLWYLKDEVNRTLGRRSVSLDDVTERHVFHGGIVDEVALGDALVLVALEARALDNDALFLELCASLARMLPLPCDSQMRAALAAVQRPVVPSALRVAKAARVERGLPELSLAHYRAASDDDA